MHRLLKVFLGLIIGYVIGALLGAAGTQAFSTNTHDKSLEVAMTSIFFFGPAGAVLGAFAGMFWPSKPKSPTA
ncbi:MAG TPA: hypothetical protein VFV47_04185 [Hyphomicrobiaceae bacterium]|nr:hypothetical protein [Hyphomicrobiaceae bacterium]